MPQEPNITGMSLRRRAVFFWGLVFVFMLLLPVMIFYTTGYRFDVFNGDTPNIVTTGGLYVSTQDTEVEVYLDEEQIERPRLFRSAYYIQNITAGQHRVVVQATGLHTWVKELPVDARIVTEAAAFNMPVVPQLRPITAFETANGTAVYPMRTATSSLFANATATEPFVVASTSATTTYIANLEYEFVASLFSSSTESNISVFQQLMDGLEGFRFVSEDESVATTSTATPETIEQNNIQLVDRNNELYAVWTGQPDNVPYYYCVSGLGVASTSVRYGQHVADAIYSRPTATSSPTFMVDNRICRAEVKLDRLRQDVYRYDFFPGSSDLVLLHLEQGLYVTEVDDRSWQNTQQLYAGTDFRTIVENGIIYIEQDGNYFEVVPQLEAN